MGLVNLKQEYEQKLMTPQQAAKLICSGDSIISTMNGTPFTLLNAIGERWRELENVRFYGENLYMPVNCIGPEMDGHINFISIFRGATERAGEKSGAFVDTIPNHIHQHDPLITEGIKPNVALLHVTPFDEDGYCTLGPNPVGGTSAVKCASKVIAQVNDQNNSFVTPESKIHISQIDAIVPVSEPMPQVIPAESSETDRKIASYIVEQIENGSTIQLGIGGIANAVGYFLEDHKDLGIHTEMFTESMVSLMRKGVVNNSKKTLYPGYSVIGFAQGTQDMYNFIQESKEILCKPIEWVADPRVIAQNNKMISLNGIMGIDIMGQVSSESVGFRQFSGTGGQLDFARGAQMSEGGKSILATPSTVNKNGTLLSKICFTRKPGTIITTPRTDVQYVCTEYGLVNLRYKSVSERAKLLISIAHPQFRDELLFEAKKNGIMI